MCGIQQIPEPDSPSLEDEKTIFGLPALIGLELNGVMRYYSAPSIKVGS
jgi:hypothetical protein